MPTVLDTKIPSKVLAIIEKYGATGSIFTKRGAGSVSFTTGGVTNPETEITPKLTPPEPYSVAYINGTTIQAGDVKVMVAAQGLSPLPAPSDRVVLFDGNEFTIEGIETIMSGESVAAYILQLRR